MRGSSDEDGNVRVDDGYPREDLEDSRENHRLQEKMRAKVESVRTRAPDARCPRCDSALSWFWFTSPPWTWEHLCGRAGVVGYCDRCDRQVAFSLLFMN